MSAEAIRARFHPFTGPIQNTKMHWRLANKKITFIFDEEQFLDLKWIEYISVFIDLFTGREGLQICVIQHMTAVCVLTCSDVS